MATTYSVCFFFRRRFRAAPAELPDGVKEIFARFAVGGVMGPEQLRRFMREVQGEDGATEEDARAVIEAQHRFGHLRRSAGLSAGAFFNYLFSDHNPPVSLPLGVHEDMNAPFSHYFIYTGHNSYLTGNQLSSECSDIPIIKALHRGVRVVELDMWPNSTKDNVNVLHGRTLTTPVELIKCLRSIKSHAFATSPYPVIITLEDHLTADLQDKVAQMLIETFGEMLYIPESEFSDKFPSPDALKFRIMISTKPPKEYLEYKSESRKEVEEDKWGSESPSRKAGELVIVKDCSLEEEDVDGFEQKQTLIAASRYKSLIAITAKKRSKSSITESLLIDPHQVTRLSLSENDFEKATMSHSTELVKFTQHNLLRIYPRGTRITSSNYNPVVGWIHGAQMVALNMQGYGKALWLMQGMFRANGGCGYVKKPDILLNRTTDNRVFDPKACLPVKTTLKVTVYMGDGWRFDFHKSHFDAYSPPDFYTRVGIAGVPADTAMRRTRTIVDSWAPLWEEAFVFPLAVPELALLRVEVHEYDMSQRDDFGGQTCLPVWELRRGIRSVPLFDRRGDKYRSVKLLMRFEFI